MQLANTQIAQKNPSPLFESIILQSLQEIDHCYDEICEFTRRLETTSIFDQDIEIVRNRLIAQKSQKSKPFIVVLRENGLIVCIATFVYQTTKLPLKFSIFNIASIETSIIKLIGRDFIFDDSVKQAECYDLVFSILGNFPTDAKIISLPEIIEGSVLDEVLRKNSLSRIGSWRHRDVTSKYQSLITHQLADNYNDWFMSLSGKERNVFRSKSKKLGETSYGGLSLRKFDNPNGVNDFLEALDIIYPNTWQCKTYGIKKWNSDSTRELFLTASRNGWLRGYVLYLGSKPIAFELGFKYKGVFEGAETGYDLEFSKFSPGAVLIHLVIEDLYSLDPPKILDWGFGEADYKRRLGTQETPVGSHMLIKPSLWLLYFDIQRITNFFYEKLRDLALATGFDGPIRNFLKNK